ncbi:MAG: CDP-diacylglycerol--serine O-phosphatidyltransferase [Mariprofundaceae bacterium]|nr:CDP-diacylglycerol--serine O-phosphatidyltransferase [Mariprofundaceae bacterium]
MRETSQQRRAVYILPSLFTTMGLFAGFYSLIASVQGRFELAAWTIIAAAIFDILDGRVARLLNAETSFGAEYDSLCDMLSFGIAPAVLVYLWALTPLGKPGWLAAFLMVAGAALRLARFNVQHDVQDKRYFSGLPTPAAALLIASAVLFYHDIESLPWSWLWWMISVALAWLMVSNTRFISGKDIDLRKGRQFTLVLLMVMMITIVMVAPYRILFAVFMAYCLHGSMMCLWQHHRIKELRQSRRQRRAERKQQQQPSPTTETVEHEEKD